MADSREIVERAARGEAEALNALLGAHLPGLRAFVRLRMGGDLRAKESSSDIVQDVFLEVVKDLGNYEYRGEAGFKHWLYTRAEHKVIDRARYYHRDKRDVDQEARARPEGDDLDLLDCYKSFFTPSQHASAREELERAERAFQKLPESYREVILLSRVVGLSHAEIAERTGRSLQAVYTVVSRALARLASLME